LTLLKRVDLGDIEQRASLMLHGKKATQRIGRGVTPNS
jgi:hypothetical protein